jgi:hypothetical protein
MYTTVTSTRMESDSIHEVGKLFTQFDASEAPRLSCTRRRQLFSYNGLLIHVQDFDHEHDGELREEARSDPRATQLVKDLSPFVADFDQASGDLPLDAMASRFYRWEGEPAGKDEILHSTVIVNRMAPTAIPEVSRLFAELDATDFPHRMGTRHRQLFSYHGVYFHIQHFVRVDGSALIDQAWTEADPRFIKICRELGPIVPPYDPATWRSPADTIANRFYHWKASA